MTDTQMLAQWACRRYGGPDVLMLENLPLPVPRPREVLIRIRACTVSTGDARIRGLRLPRGMGVLGRLALGLTGPRQPVLGADLAGDVVAIGPAVTRFAVGDRVVGFPDIGLRCHASHRVMREDGLLLPTPQALTDAEAVSLCFGGLTAQWFLRKSGIKAGQRLLVIGAAGAVGAAMVQLAQHIGAHVTAVAGAANQDFLRGLGVDVCIDYRDRLSGGTATL